SHPSYIHHGFECSIFFALTGQDHQRGVLKGLKINPCCPQLSHVLFRDDVVVFGKANISKASKLQLLGGSKL
ncbi:hypothetical protein LINPERHAP1_LOCUS23877, partial [Linum perenne]